MNDKILLHLSWCSRFVIGYDIFRTHLISLLSEAVVKRNIINPPKNPAKWFLDKNWGMGVLITPMALANPLLPIKSRSRNKRRNPWVRWCVFSWRPWFWPVYSIYYNHTIHYSCNIINQNKLFLRDIYTKNWCGHAGVLDDIILLLFSIWFQLYISIS